MGFNKNKALESALKYLNQGKLTQAIGEYQQILRHDAKDQATLMTVGDLYARQGDMAHAVEYFERLAQVYLSDGFNSKAIAIYKKIAKLAPAELAPLERLADLYVQQGVLSEARPLFLQIAEAHLKANRSQRAVEVLHRLLDVEPDNPRVQMRLAELYNVMGQKKEAAQTYVAYAQRLVDRGETDEAQKLAERALEVDPSNATALLLKGKALIGANKTEEAIRVLASHPEANSGGDVTDMLIDLEMQSGHAASAIERARKRLATGHAHYAQLLKVTDALIETGQAEEALPLLRELRDPMIEATEQDRFLKTLTNVTQKSPESLEALEIMVDFCRHTSDPFRLNAALDQLAEGYAKSGNHARAEELLKELAERNKDDERVVEKLNQVRGRAAGTAPAAEVAAPVETNESARSETVANLAQVEETGEEAPTEPIIIEEELDEETQRYIAQALTDVDLFSSYGLTQKATHLLENVLQRAPRHTPTLERLLDLYLGAGNERRTAEAAGLLEQIHRQRNDTVAADHFAELRKRFQKAAGIEEHELPAAPPVGAPPMSAAPAVSVGDGSEAQQAQGSTEAAPITAGPEPAGPAEFEVPLGLAAPEAEPVEARGSEAASIFAPAPEAPAKLENVSSMEEVDLSDEWEAMAREVGEPQNAKIAAEPVAKEQPVEAADSGSEAATGHEMTEADLTAELARQFAESQAQREQQEQAEQQPEPQAEIQPVELGEGEPDAQVELIEEAEAPTGATSNGDLSATGTPAPEAPVLPQEIAPKETAPHAFTTDDFISELVAEIEEPNVAETQTPQSLESIFSAPLPAPVAQAPSNVAASPGVTPPSIAAAPAQPAAPEPAPEVTAEALNQLADVFQEFQSEMGDIEDADEDLETHYNLGIAYREMGLLDEAIGEFQKVATAVQKGKPFVYTMNCSTMLALCFMDKGEAKIASLWYRRALETPGLDQESVLALRYDLAIALEAAGDAKSALDSFQQVYAMNIDYRDVADRIATLHKHETHV